jgi:two-component system, OmpR family, sensor histidine kinase SenX3
MSHDAAQFRVIISAMKFQRPVLNLIPSSQFIVTAVMMLLLPLFAVLQYSWLGQLSASNSEQMKMHMQSVATRFSQDFDQEITRTYAAFMSFQEMKSEDRLKAYVSNYDRWNKSSSHPGLVKAVFLALTDERRQLHLYKLDSEARKFETHDWPQTMTTLRHQLEDLVRNPPVLGPPPPGIAEPSPHPMQLLDEELPALVTMLVKRPVWVKNGFALAPPQLVGCAIIVLDMLYIQQEMLPSLVKRHFLSDDLNNYDLTIVSGKDQERIIYRSDSITGRADGSFKTVASNSDASADIFSLRADELRYLLRRHLQRGDFKDTNRPNRRAGPATPVLGPMGFREGWQPGLWQIHIRHRAGSLEAFVNSVRRRNLLISFGILGLLGASIALLIVSARRARRLAEQQMDFVAGVSHELRTPLAVIESAAYNLDKGVIRAPQKVQNYGALIRKETGRLKEMVEQTLELAGVQSGRQQYNLQAVSINQILDDVLSSSQPLLAEGGFQIDSDIASDLPPVMADRTALARAFQNLINNAMKYSGDSKWIGLSARAVEADGDQSVQLIVADHGIGIPDVELSQIFEPFYRGSAARAAQIHGNGLGLSLIKNIIAAHRGTIEVKSAPGAGSSFVISLPVTAAVEPNKTATIAGELSYE